MAGTRTVTLLAGTLALAAGCKGPPVASPLTSESRWLCCNLSYQKPKIQDVGFQVGTRIPFGTRVQVLEVYASSVKFQPDGHPPIELVYRVNKKGGLAFEQYLERLFVTSDPRATLKKVPAKRVKLIEDGVVEAGMTRPQVLMALGYPPAHETPSLESPAWHYWRDRWHRFIVHFDGDKVTRVQN
jgi:hypothetical protein